jgi:hypothetical protein
MVENDRGYAERRNEMGLKRELVLKLGLSFIYVFSLPRGNRTQSYESNESNTVRGADE